MKKLSTVLIFASLFFASISFGQVLVTEEFEYTSGTFLTDNGYTAHSGGTTNAITVVSGNLTYPGYQATGLGNEIQLVNTGQDCNKTLAADVTSGTLYAFMLVNVDSARTGDYFFHFGPNPISTTFRARVFVKKALNGNLSFGVSVGSINATTPATYTDSIYTPGTTYLVVSAYQIVDGATNDVVKLWVNPALGGTEPPALLTITDAAMSDINVGSYAFRQGTAASGPFLKLDGLILSTGWLATVPVELTSFSADVNRNNVNLSWKTATETNNQGFQIERKAANTTWETIGFVNGKGTTTEIQSYNFSDKNLNAGKYSYRLKQVDFNGTFEYSSIVEAEVIAVNKFELSQNYPNPFNPSTKITFSIAQAGNVKLAVYNLLGQEVKVLVDGFTAEGTHTINFDASDLNSGVYIYKIETSNFTQARKMTLIK